MSTIEDRQQTDPMLDVIPFKFDREKPTQYLDDAMKLINDDYYVSTRDVCKIFRASRRWVSDHTRPNAHHIYVPHTFMKDIAELQLANEDHRMVAGTRQVPDMSSTWCKGSDIAAILSRCPTVFVRNKVVHMCDLLNDYDAYRAYADEQRREIDEKHPKMRPSLRLDMYEDALSEYLAEFETDAWAFIRKYANTNRKAQPWIPVDVTPEFWDYVIKYAPLYVVADKLDYGDVPETVYREMFRCAAVKVELNVPDADGAIASKPRALYTNMHRNEWSDVFEKWWVDWNAPIDVDMSINQYLA